MLLTEKRLQCRSNDMITAMTEAAIFTIGRSIIIGYGKIRPVLFVGLSNSIKSSNHFLKKTMRNFELILNFNHLWAGSLGLRIKPSLF